jgi:putative NADH-flavin reductase
MKQITIFGGTGPSGQCIIEEALSRNYTVTVYARNPSKLPENITSSPSVTLVKGSLSDIDAIRESLKNSDAVLSALGPSLSVGTAVHGLTQHGTPIADGYKVILESMKMEGVKRLIALGTVSMQAEEDGRSIVTWGMVTAVWAFLHSAWKDVVAFGNAITSSNSDIDWTIARVGRLTNGKLGKVQAGYIGKEGSRVFVSRKDLAKWYLDELENGAWIHKLPVVYSL